MTEALLPPATPTHDDELRQRLSRLNIILIAMFATILIVPAVGSWWIARQLPIVNTVDISDVMLISDSVLCPNDPVVFSYHFNAKGTGVLVRDKVLWRRTPPPKTLIFSTTRRFILSDPVDQRLTEAWHIPERYINPETDLEEDLPPGDYRLIFSISSPSRSTVIAIAYVDFILEDCKT